MLSGEATKSISNLRSTVIEVSMLTITQLMQFILDRSCPSVILVEENSVSREKHIDKLYHIKLYQVHHA